MSVSYCQSFPETDGKIAIFLSLIISTLLWRPNPGPVVWPCGPSTCNSSLQCNRSLRKRFYSERHDARRREISAQGCRPGRGKSGTAAVPGRGSVRGPVHAASTYRDPPSAGSGRKAGIDWASCHSGNVPFVRETSQGIALMDLRHDPKRVCAISMPARREMTDDVPSCTGLPNECWP